MASHISRQILIILCLSLHSEPGDSIEMEELNTNKRSITPPMSRSSRISYAEDVDMVRLFLSLKVDEEENVSILCLVLNKANIIREGAFIGVNTSVNEH